MDIKQTREEEVEKVKKYLLFVAVMCFMLVTSACGNSENASGEEVNEKKVENKNDNKKESKDEKKDELNTYIEERTGGKTKVIYTDKKPDFSQEMKGLKISLNQYEVVKLEGVGEAYTGFFDDKDEGYVITAEMTLDNQGEETFKYPGKSTIKSEDESIFLVSDIRNLIREEDRLLSPENGTEEFKPGVKKTGLVTFLLKNEDYEALASGTTRFIIEPVNYEGITIAELTEDRPEYEMKIQ